PLGCRPLDSCAVNAAFAQGCLESRVDRLGLKGEHAEHALVHTPERLVPDEPFERLDAKAELSRRLGPLLSDAAPAEAFQVRGLCVFGPVDDPEVLAAAALERRL